MEKAPSDPTMRSQVTSLGTLSCLKNKINHQKKKKKSSGENDEVPLLGIKSSDLIMGPLLTFTYLI